MPGIIARGITHSLHHVTQTGAPDAAGATGRQYLHLQAIPRPGVMCHHDVLEYRAKQQNIWKGQTVTSSHSRAESAVQQCCRSSARLLTAVPTRLTAPVPMNLGPHADGAKPKSLNHSSYSSKNSTPAEDATKSETKNTIDAPRLT